MHRLGFACRLGLALLGLLAIAGCQKQPEVVETRPADHILAVSWQPAFCEFKPQKKECRTQTHERPDASQFSLHGLWPQPRGNVYCGVSKATIDLDKQGRWMKLERLELESETRQLLKTVMPGYQSGLHRHEWVKHGTCYGQGGAQRYYQDSVALMAALNRSKLAKLFAEHVGSHLTRRTIRAALNESFGDGAGDRIRLKCRVDQDSGRRLIVELTLGLAGKFDGANSLKRLMLSADPAPEGGCPGGIIDPVGLQ